MRIESKLFVFPLLVIASFSCKTTTSADLNTTVVDPKVHNEKMGKLASDLLIQAIKQNKEVADAYGEITQVIAMPGVSISNTGYERKCFTEQEFQEQGNTLYVYKFAIETKMNGMASENRNQDNSEYYTVTVPYPDAEKEKTPNTNSYTVQVPVKNENSKPDSTNSAKMGNEGYKIKILFETDPIDQRSYSIRPFRVLKVKSMINSTPC